MVDYVTRVFKLDRAIYDFNEIHRFRWVVFSFISSTLRARYKRSFLGLIWTMLGPLLNYLIMGLVVSTVARFNVVGYLPGLLLGSVVFNFISNSFGLGGLSLIHNEHYIKKIYLPKMVFPLSFIGMEFLNFFFGLSGLCVVLFMMGELHLTLGAVFLPFALLLLFLFVLGVGCVFSVLYVFFRDLVHLVPILMQASFFLTPIVYPESTVPEKYYWLLKFNPYYYFIKLIRGTLAQGGFDAQAFVIPTVLSALAVALGVTVLKKYENRVVFKL